MESGSFRTLASRGMAETRVKGSVFLALAASAESEEMARRILGEQEREYFTASHHCSAWRLRDGVWRSNDAGEPSGSAGAPILAAIDGENLTNCVVVVSRIFGGTKLGIGGLIRAYGEAAAAALADARRREGMPAVRLRVRYPYGHTAAVMRVLEQAEVTDIVHGFVEGGEQGEVEFSVPLAHEDEIDAALREQSAGLLVAERMEERLLYRTIKG